MEYCFDNFTECFRSLVKEVYYNNDFVSSPRGLQIKEKLGVSFEITNPRNRLLYVKSRKFSLEYMVAECLWYLSGNNETRWISKYSKFWKNISDDGIHANSAYGYRIFTNKVRNPANSIISSIPISQWQYVIDELKKDPDSRRAVIHIRVPSDSQFKLDVPCTLTLQYFIRDNKLYSIVNMRSTDIIFGLSYDVPAFTMFQELMALELGVELGTYKHISNSLHVYERHFEMCENIINEIPEHECIQMNEIKKHPNMDALMKIEEKLSSSTTPEKLMGAWEEFVNIRDNNETFWNDMLTVLFATKSRKLKDELLVSFFTRKLKFSGYKNILLPKGNK